jgi:hypothetical protein
VTRSSVRRCFAVLFLTLGLGAAGAPVSAQQAGGDAPAEPVRIGTITIRPLDVFSPEEASRGWLYRTANAVRFNTRPSVIRKFLLFQEGDVYDPLRLDETERNLRALPFLKSALVSAGKPHDGVVDVEVITQDAWTTEPGISFGKKGGVTTYGFDLKEKDFLGTGRTLAIAYDQDVERSNRSLEYIDPYFLGQPYVLADFLYSNNSDGEEERIAIGRPFAAFSSRNSAGVVFDHLIQNERIFADGDPVARFRQHHVQGDAQLGWAIAASETRAQRGFVRFRSFEDRFALLPDSPEPILPEDRLFRFVTLGYQDIQNDFLKKNFVNRAERYEDFNLGRVIDVEAGVSPTAFGTAKTTAMFRLEVGEGWRLGLQTFLLGAASYRTRYDGHFQNEIVSGNLFFVHEFSSTLPRQTFVSRLVFDRGWNLDKDVQFFADGDNGLRGYKLYAFEGNKRVVWNAEQRFFLGREILQLFSLGAAAFFDTGAATPENEPLTIKDFKSDVGVGLRIGITRAATNSTVRIDFAYALNPDAKGRRGFLVSFSSGQGF